MPPIVDAQAKAARLAAMRERHAGDGGIAIAIGDGANDVPMLKAADVSIAYRAKPVVRAQATYAIDHCGLDAVLNLFALTRFAPRVRARRSAGAARADRSVVVEVALVHPRHLDRFEDLLAAVLRVVVEPGQLEHPALEIREQDGARVDVGMRSASAMAISRVSVHFIGV